MIQPTGPETPRQRLKRIRTMIEAGLLSEPRAGLEAMSRDPAVRGDPSLGTATVLGYPRKLHSAWLKLAKAEGNIVDRIGLQHTLVPPPALLAPLTAFDGQMRRAMNAVNRQPVPLILHQIWLGDLPLPPATEAWRRHAEANGLEYRLWREADLEELGVPLHPAYLQMLDAGDYPGAVDIARYFVLHAAGGLYLDCDWYPARDDVSFADVLPLTGLAALAEDTPRETGAGSLLFTNSFIAAPASHPVFARLLDILPEVVRLLPEGPAWWSTGPLILSLLFRQTTVQVPDASIVVANLARGAPMEAVAEARQQAFARDGGLLIAWKSW
ncbi:Glycosyltransferase sugar-binding region containing DXD motif-containing protein [Rhizobium sp. RU35A]|uniref:glycosyltransferase family 32 protein n=1 Tax=Rhizobium sp. RU35A TaxID=1907414 RepID=UPI000955D75C|nr:glycosyltransferase [Rhizobium sp. RU35A]SIQ85391.1 Glycosyltransferase sugar-binding region containing DXD motif-containing protein [Rhizobium sp. RU35A]